MTNGKAKFVRVSQQEWASIDAIETVQDAGGDGVEIRMKSGRSFRIAEKDREDFISIIDKVTV